MSNDNRIDIQTLIDIAKQAGNAVLKIYNSPQISICEKSDSSPLTEADLAASKIITDQLTSFFPEIPIISEESLIDDYSIRKKWTNFFLVDPLDGTKEFIKKNGEFTVNIAYIENKVPLMGVVYCPVLDIIYYSDGVSSYKIEHEKTMRIPKTKAKNTVTIVASRSHLDQKTSTFINRLSDDHKTRIISMGSSIKICLVAEGDADIYPRFAPTSEWDTAAAHAIIKASGAEIYNSETLEKLTYNKFNILNPSFIAIRDKRFLNYLK